jgi:hypothetical protein
VGEGVCESGALVDLKQDLGQIKGSRSITRSRKAIRLSGSSTLSKLLSVSGRSSAASSIETASFSGRWSSVRR